MRSFENVLKGHEIPTMNTPQLHLRNLEAQRRLPPSKMDRFKDMPRERIRKKRKPNFKATTKAMVTKEPSEEVPALSDMGLEKENVKEEERVSEEAPSYKEAAKESQDGEDQEDAKTEEVVAMVADISPSVEDVPEKKTNTIEGLKDGLVSTSQNIMSDLSRLMGLE